MEFRDRRNRARTGENVLSDIILKFFLLLKKGGVNRTLDENLKTHKYVRVMTQKFQERVFPGEK